MKFVIVAVGVLAYIAVILSLTFHPAAAADCWVGNTVCLSPNDMGAFLSGIFAPLAFAWLAWSVVMQSKELALQREELKLTREEMKEARAVAEATGLQVKAQAEAMTAQTDFIRWQFEEQKIDSKEREITRLFDALNAIIKTSISDETIIQVEHNGGTYNHNLVDHFIIEKIDDLPSHVALGIMHDQFITRYQRCIDLINNPATSEVIVHNYETLDRISDLLGWIISVENQVRSAVQTDIYSAKIYSYRDIVQKIKELKDWSRGQDHP
ncbi:hypothetical protein QBD01_001069 [Ochrobactrum sp. 19YEA23]|uniref:hypothetical protein n=1 Tax=Ochrobactrum sp. 19YEA23 TaxID=3039854 RepID=UPI00247906AB|nr:hypothetical protein [Ochrobactrum sp. 19YEA23]